MNVQKKWYAEIAIDKSVYLVSWLEIYYLNGLKERYEGQEPELTQQLHVGHIPFDAVNVDLIANCICFGFYGPHFNADKMLKL